MVLNLCNHPAWILQLDPNDVKWRDTFDSEPIKVNQFKAKLQILNCLWCQFLNNLNEFCAERSHGLKEETHDIMLRRILNRNNLIKTNHGHLQEANTMLRPSF